MTSAEERPTQPFSPHKEPDEERLSDLDRVKRTLEEARQTVAPIVKQEMAAEVISADLLNTRLRNDCRT